MFSKMAAVSSAASGEVHLGNGFPTSRALMPNTTSRPPSGLAGQVWCGRLLVASFVAEAGRLHQEKLDKLAAKQVVAGSRSDFFNEISSLFIIQYHSVPSTLQGQVFLGWLVLFLHKNAAVWLRLHSISPFFLGGGTAGAMQAMHVASDMVWHMVQTWKRACLTLRLRQKSGPPHPKQKSPPSRAVREREAFAKVELDWSVLIDVRPRGLDWTWLVIPTWSPFSPLVLVSCPPTKMIGQRYYATRRILKA